VSYLLLVGVPLAAVLVILGRGNPRAVGENPAFAAPSSSPFMARSIVVMILTTLVATRTVGGVATRMGRPRVIGGMLAGIFLGPSVLGWFAPGLAGVLFSADNLPYLSVLGQLGLILFMFIVGLSVNLGELRSCGRSAVLISHVSITAFQVLAIILDERGMLRS